MKTKVLLLCFFLSSFAVELAAQARTETGICRLKYRLVNRNRHVQGHSISAECSLVPLFAHSSPFGNWGVDSNLGDVQNSRQFDGWKLISNLLQWNSCTSNTTNFPAGCSEPPGGWPDNPPPHADEGPYYNAGNCQEQSSNSGVPNWDIHAGSPQQLEIDCPVSCSNGCLEVNGYQLTVANHFMDTYEIDSPGSDVQTGHMTFGTQVAIAECSHTAYCGSSLSPWIFGQDSSTGVDAEAAVEITNGIFIDINGQCSQ